MVGHVATRRRRWASGVPTPGALPDPWRASLPQGGRYVRRVRRSLSAAALIAAGLAAASAPRVAVGQGFHPLPGKVRPLHQRLAEADVVALATVATVGDGRYRLTHPRALLGRVDAARGAFEVKRSPSRPLPLAEGDEVLLLLMGARSPYVPVDRPDEIVRLEGDPDRWRAEVRDAVACLREPSGWPALYLRWVDRGPDTLRELAALGLFDLRAPFQPVDARLYVERADVAWDPERPVEVRRISARLALLAPAGAARLAAGAATCDPGGLDQGVLATALRGADLYALPTLDDVLACAGSAEDEALASLTEQVRRRARAAERP